MLRACLLWCLCCMSHGCMWTATMGLQAVSTAATYAPALSVLERALQMPR